MWLQFKVLLALKLDFQELPIDGHMLDIEGLTREQF